MDLLLSFNGQILPHTAAARLSAISSAALYGRGIFTTLAACRGKPFLWNLHEKRLQQNALKIGLDARAINLKKIQDSLFELIKVNQINNGRARITLFDSGSSRIWQPAENAGEISFLITTAERRETPLNNIKLTISPFPLNSASPLAGVKSCNYLENILALETANKQNFDESIRLNERGEIASAIMANLFWTIGEQIFTPNLQTGALAGTTREFIIGLSKEMGFVVKEKTALLKDLHLANEIFLTSAGLGVCLAKSLDSHILETRISSKIQTAFSEIIND